MNQDESGTVILIVRIPYRSSSRSQRHFWVLFSGRTNGRDKI